jgi:hypothetical protein
MRKQWWMAVTLLVVSTKTFAQDTAITSPPPNLIVPNYNGVPSGPLGGLEGSAYIARAADTSAPWFNPAGLSRAGTQISGSAGTYKLTTLTPGFLATTGGSTEQIPNLAGATAKWRKFTFGFALLTTISWSQGTDTDEIFTNPEGNPERLAFSADSGLHQRVSAVAVGYDLGHKWRVGGGLALVETGMRSDQIISDRIKDARGLHTLLISSRAGGSTEFIRAIVGAQIEPIPGIQFGGVFRTRGILWGRNGSFTLDSTLDGAPASVGASIFDQAAHFDYQLPFEGGFGVAYLGRRAEIEFDIQGYSSIAPHPLLTASEPLTIYTDPGTGAPPTIDTRPLAPVITASRALANYSVGGHYQLLQSRPLTVHAGVATDRSPVAPEDQVFDEVSFIVWTAGVSGSVGKLSFALGANYRRGVSESVVLRNLLNEPIQTSMSIKTVGVTYSINYKFGS